MTTKFAQAPGLMDPHSFSMPSREAGEVVIDCMATVLSSPRAMAFRICGNISLASLSPLEVITILTPALASRPGFSGASSQCVSSSNSVSSAASAVATLGGFGKLTGTTMVRFSLAILSSNWYSWPEPFRTTFKPNSLPKESALMAYCSLSASNITSLPA